MYFAGASHGQRFPSVKSSAMAMASSCIQLSVDSVLASLNICDLKKARDVMCKAARPNSISPLLTDKLLLSFHHTFPTILNLHHPHQHHNRRQHKRDNHSQLHITQRTSRQIASPAARLGARRYPASRAFPTLCAAIKQPGDNLTGPYLYASDCGACPAGESL